MHLVKMTLIKSEVGETMNNLHTLTHLICFAWLTAKQHDLGDMVPKQER
jgi:hypothetical protein